MRYMLNFEVFNKTYMYISSSYLKLKIQFLIDIKITYFN